MSTTTVYPCDECGHRSLDHEGPGSHARNRVGPCSFGGCACDRTRAEVESSVEPVTRPTVPAFDHATGEWAER